ncbi:hypothetical protein ACFL2Q_05535 [Thermodesulfobacteriota bacterium]
MKRMRGRSYWALFILIILCSVWGAPNKGQAAWTSVTGGGFKKWSWDGTLRFSYRYSDQKWYHYSGYGDTVNGYALSAANRPGGDSALIAAINASQVFDLGNNMRTGTIRAPRTAPS